MDHRLIATGLRKTYQMGTVTVDALRGVDFVAQAGEFIAIMGPSGSGKSTLLHLLGGLDHPSDGSIRLYDQNYDALNDDELAVLRRRHIGFVFQFFNLMPTLNAAENVALPLLIDGQDPLPHAARITELLGLVGLREHANHLPAQLSGGQQQRVAIARALVTRPAIVLADEPTGNLDSHASDGILTLLRRARDEAGQTVIMVTHSSHAAAFADRVIYLKDGEIAREMKRNGDTQYSTQTLSAVLVELGA